MGLGISIPDGQDTERYFKNIINYAKDNYKDIIGEASETAGATAAAASANTISALAKSGRLEKAHMLKNPKWAAKRFIREAGPIGVALSTALDTYQGRDNAYKIFGSNPNIGQRAASIGSSIANGVTGGFFNFNNHKDIKNLYKYWANR